MTPLIAFLFKFCDQVTDLSPARSKSNGLDSVAKSGHGIGWSGLNK